MKKTVLRIALVAMLVLAMALPMVMIPAMATEKVTYYYQSDFKDLAVGTKLTDLDDNDGPFGNYLTWDAPAASQIAYDPMGGTNKVVKFDLKATATGSADDFIYDKNESNAPCVISWNDDAKTSGKVTIKSSVYDVTSLDGGKTVLVNGVYKKVYSTNAEKEIIYGGGNVNMNLTLNNKGHGTLTTGTVVFEMDLYISPDANGRLISQVYSQAAGFQQLFAISLTSSYLEPSYNHSWNAKLNKGAWNRISVVADLDANKLSYYVDNVYVGEYNCVDFPITESSWIAAKIYRGEDYIGNLDGYVCLDNANIHPLCNGEIVSASTYVDEELLSATVTTPKGHISNIMGKQALITPGAVNVETKYLDGTYTDRLLKTNLEKDVSIRLTNTGGIRFATNINTEVLGKLTDLKDKGYIKNVSVGTMIAPLDYVQRVEALTHEAFDKAGMAYLDVGGKVGSWYDSPNLTPDAGFDEIFVGSILNIKEGNRSRNFAAVGYVKVTTLGGEERYIYSYDYTDDANTSYDSIQNVADKLCYYDGKPTSFYQKLNADTQKLMDSFINGKTTGGNWGTYLQTVEYTSHEFFFTNANGVAIRFTFDGTDGWRLQAVQSTGTNARYSRFDDVGAGQALAKYLGETYSDITLALNVDDTDGSYVKLTAGEGNPYVLIYKNDSLIEFYSADGILRQDITAIKADTAADTVTMQGNLAAGEAVYGGGERFDALNRRGSSMALNISDAYNGGRGGDRYYPDTFTYTATYVAIPLFTTTRGAGMYINRYEVMTVDFDTDACNDQWRVVLDNNLMDCYFWATGKMSDALEGYTELTGTSSLPEEWAQGVMVCRYAPDFKTLEGETKEYTKLTDIPNYITLKLYNGDLAIDVEFTPETHNGYYLYTSTGTRSYRYQDGIFYRTTAKGNPAGYGVKEIVMDMIRAGMTPTAIILEAANTENISSGSIAAQENYDRLKAMVDWIHFEGNVDWEGVSYYKPAMKAMTYMGVAGMGANMPGYKSEYWLQARITGKLVTEIVNGKPNHDAHETEETSYITNQIPRRDTENPDAQGASSQSYLDITNPEAVEWYMNTVWSSLIKLGVDGVKIDFCENVLNEGSGYEDLTVRAGAIKADGSVTTKDQFVVDGTLEYLPYDDSIMEGDEMHHAYPTFFISMFYKAANELIDARKISDDFVVLSRGGGIGSQRNPYMWTGDNTREFSALSMQLRAILSSGLSGLPFITPDMAGYAYHYGTAWGDDVDYKRQLLCVETGEYLTTRDAIRVWEGEIFTRSLQYMAFTTNIQTHGDVLMVQDFTSQVQGISKTYTDLHNDLMWYIQKVSTEATVSGMPAVRHMVVNYQNDANVYDLNDQFMLGDGILVAPIMESTAVWTYKTTTYLGSEYYVNYNGSRVCKVSDATDADLAKVARTSSYYADLAASGSDPSITKTMTRDVYLPAGEWVNALTGEVINSTGKTVSVPVAFNQIPVFINAGSKDAQSLIDNVFNKSAWQEINGKKTIADVGYTITFVDHDGEVISKNVYEEGETVVVPADPTRAQDDTYTYTFAGWDKEVSPTANASVTYKATYTETYREYTVTFVDENGTKLHSAVYHYGEDLSAPAAPVKAQDDIYTYAFSGWIADEGDEYTGKCNGDATYKATYTATLRTYTVKFLNWDGEVIETLTLTWGQEFTAPADPTKASTEKFDYVFAGWDNTVPANCNGDATFTAVYEEFYNSTYDPVGDDIFPEL